MNLKIPDMMNSGEKSKSYLDKFVESTQKFMNRQSSKSPYYDEPRMKKSHTDVHPNRKAYASNSSRVREFPKLDASPSKANRKVNGSFFQDKKFS